MIQSTHRFTNRIPAPQSVAIIQELYFHLILGLNPMSCYAYVIQILYFKNMIYNQKCFVRSSRSKKYFWVAWHPVRCQVLFFFFPLKSYTVSHTSKTVSKILSKFKQRVYKTYLVQVGEQVGRGTEGCELIAGAETFYFTPNCS